MREACSPSEIRTARAMEKELIIISVVHWLEIELSILCLCEVAVYDLGSSPVVQSSSLVRSTRIMRSEGGRACSFQLCTDAQRFFDQLESVKIAKEAETEAASKASRHIMDKITHRTLELSGIRIHIAEMGSGPLVVLVHGFPSLWYSWRHQIPFLAEAGFHVVAMDLRGFGQSDVPSELSKYTQLHHAGDVIGLIDALGEKQAYLVGHDWGSTVASNVALFRPDLVRGLVNLGVPFTAHNPKVDMLTAIRATVGESVYILRWQSTEGGEAEADFAKQGTKTALAKVYSYHSPEVLTSKNGKTVLEGLTLPDPLPAWLTDKDLLYYADSFDKTGFTGAFNLYRTIGSTFELMTPWANKGISAVSLFITGDQDMTCTMMAGYLTSPAYKKLVPNLKEVIILPGVGHFLAEEEPDQVNKLLLKFLKEN